MHRRMDVATGRRDEEESAPARVSQFKLTDLILDTRDVIESVCLLRHLFLSGPFFVGHDLPRVANPQAFLARVGRFMRLHLGDLVIDDDESFIARHVRNAASPAIVVRGTRHVLERANGGRKDQVSVLKLVILGSNGFIVLLGDDLCCAHRHSIAYCVA